MTHRPMGSVPRPSVGISFAPDVDPVIVARILHTLRVYAAVYGLSVAPPGSADAVVAYGPLAPTMPNEIRLPAHYVVRPHHRRCPSPVWVDGIPSFHHGATGPDRLGDAFEWLGAQHELACTEPDAVGRVPPSQMLAGTHGLDPAVPWASRSLAALHAQIRERHGTRWPEAPVADGRQPWIVLSHDVDVLPQGHLRDVRRLATNVALAAAVRRDAKLVGSVLASTARRLARRQSTVSAIDDLLAVEREAGVAATYTFVARSDHHQDPGYDLTEPTVASVLARVRDAGHEVGVHGSFTSLDQEDRLADEYRLLAAAGTSPTGGRQHWLRYRGPELFRALVRAGATWDSTAGYPDRVGFRHGAAFPFPPYDFAAEAAFPLLEIPLVLMDQALYLSGPSAAWPDTWESLHAEIGRAGWGGVSVLWHDHLLAGTTFPTALGELYGQTVVPSVMAVTAGDLVTRVTPRYAAAGLTIGRGP